uniref:Uncharacterized protein n=1 Tax=Anguilla anguilla TaxID=7936 RepID=A0A0E9PH92_ANGAN
MYTATLSVLASVCSPNPNLKHNPQSLVWGF